MHTVPARAQAPSSQGNGAAHAIAHPRIKARPSHVSDAAPPPHPTPRITARAPKHSFVLDFGSLQFNVACGSRNDFATGKELAGDNCSIELANSITGEGFNLCVNFQSDAVTQLLTCNDNNANQDMTIFSTN
ncbi:hypothetical protein C8R44DRAFT_877003 [Mycena epipterygia]|nr:hypothetical protein C8R44DRAFT_877003 [Mycena epipterygia]